MTVPRLDELSATLAELVEADPEVVAASANLFELGLDSISLMRLVAGWRRAGLEIDFGELAARPTVAAWAGLIAARRAAARARGPARVPLPAGPSTGGPVPPGAEFPLAPPQHAHWVGRGTDQPWGGVGAHLYIEFDGPALDPERLAAALGRLVRRHDMLRVRIGEDGGQWIADRPSWRGLAVHDLRGHAPAEVERVLAAARDEYSHQLLAVADGEVLSTAVSLLPGDRTRLHLDLDLIAADALSCRVLLAELAALYTDPDTAPPVPAGSYREYLAATAPDAAPEHAAARRRAEGYWRARLDDLPGPPELPGPSDPPGASDPDRPPAEGPAGRPARTRRVHLWLDPDRRGRLEAGARAAGVTPAAALATAFAEVVGAWSATPEFLLAVPLFDRVPLHPDIDRLVGDFSRSVLLAVDLSAPLPFADRVRRVQAQLHTDAAHAEFGGVEVLRELARHRRTPVPAPVVFTSALGLGELFAAPVAAAFGDPVWILSQCPQVLLDAQVTELSRGLLVNWDARVSELADGVLDEMFAAFERLVGALADDPDQWHRPALPDPAGDGVPAAGDGMVGDGIDGVEARVVDAQGRDRPPLVPGELWVDGAGVARGEGDDAGPAAARFVTRGGRRWCRTGDRVRRRRDGKLEWLGRDDERIRLHGVPVEPAAVEAPLRADARIRDVAAALSGSELGVAVVPAGPLSVTDVRELAAARLAPNLVPARVLLVDALPVGRSGRPDRAALAVLLARPDAAPAPGPVAPRDELERVVAGLWAATLGGPEPGVTDDFLAAGGDSVRAVALVTALREALLTTVPPGAVLAERTVARLAARLRRDEPHPGRLDKVAALFREVVTMSDAEVAAALSADDEGARR